MCTGTFDLYQFTSFLKCHLGSRAPWGGCRTFPSKLSCCISWSLLPMPMKAHGCDSCSEQPSRSICSFFFFQPLPIRYTHGGGQKNLRATTKTSHASNTKPRLGMNKLSNLNRHRMAQSRRMSFSNCKGCGCCWPDNNN